MTIKVKKSILRDFVKFCIANKMKPGYFNHVDHIVRYGECDKNGLVKINKDLVEWLCKWYDAFHVWKYSTYISPKPKFYFDLKEYIK